MTKTAEEIVRALAKCDEPTTSDERRLWCALCASELASISSECAPSAFHSDTCPWRLAVEWVAQNPSTAASEIGRLQCELAAAEARDGRTQEHIGRVRAPLGAFLKTDDDPARVGLELLAGRADRLASDAVAAQEELREELRSRGLWINSAGKLVELCAYHDTNPAHDHVMIDKCGPSCAWNVEDCEDRRPD